MNPPCFECGSEGHERHHVVPKSVGGTNTVWLCSNCHGAVHGVRRMNIAALTRAGIAKRRALGLPVGRARQVSGEVEARIVRMKSQGMTIRAIGQVLADEGIVPPGGTVWHPSTIYRIIMRDQ